MKKKTSSGFLFILQYQALGLHHHGPSPTSKTNDTHTKSHDFHHHRKRDTHAGDNHHHGNNVDHDHHHQADAHLDRDHNAVHIEEEHHVEPYQWYCMVLLLGKMVFLLGKTIYPLSLSLTFSDSFLLYQRSACLYFYGCTCTTD